MSREKTAALSGSLILSAILASTISLLGEITVKNGEPEFDDFSQRSESIMLLALGASFAAATNQFLSNRERDNSDEDVDD